MQTDNLSGSTVSANRHILELVNRVRNGELRALARAISTVEDRTPEAMELLKRLFPYSGNAGLIGLTGSPGAGKSTLVDQIARQYRKHGKRTKSTLSRLPT